MKQSVIIGASSVLGSAIAQTLVENDFTVLGTSRKEKTLEKVHSATLDMDSRDSINTFCATLKSDMKIDVLVFTVSDELLFERFEKTPIESFEKSMQIGVINTIYLLQKLLPYMNKDSNIVFVLSEMTKTTPAYFSSYITSKYAMLGCMKSLANELQSKHIRVNAISPGLMNTPFIAQLPDMIKKVATKNDQWVCVETVAKKILEIHNSSMTGENIFV